MAGTSAGHDGANDQTHTHATKNARKPRAFVGDRSDGDYAACLCMAPEADAVPRIALIERSIAAHSRLISEAARPSASYSRAPSPWPSASKRSARLVIWPPHTGARNFASVSRAMVTIGLSESPRLAGAPLSTTAYGLRAERQL